MGEGRGQLSKFSHRSHYAVVVGAAAILLRFIVENIRSVSEAAGVLLFIASLSPFQLSFLFGKIVGER